MLKQIKRTNGKQEYYIYKEQSDGYYTMNKENGKISHAIKPKDWFIVIQDGFTIDEVMTDLGYRPNPTRVKGFKRKNSDNPSPREQKLKFEYQGRIYEFNRTYLDYVMDENAKLFPKSECVFYPVYCKSGRISKDYRIYPKDVKVYGIHLPFKEE